jgi:hypothetical protein
MFTSPPSLVTRCFSISFSSDIFVWFVGLSQNRLPSNPEVYQHFPYQHVIFCGCTTFSDTPKYHITLAISHSILTSVFPTSPMYPHVCWFYIRRAPFFLCMLMVLSSIAFEPPVLKVKFQMFMVDFRFFMDKSLCFDG